MHLHNIELQIVHKHPVFDNHDKTRMSSGSYYCWPGTRTPLDLRKTIAWLLSLQSLEAPW